ncbi:AAA family ATPase [Streptomyces sp. NPDC046976]|uniref:AAA family ATPase n=1 Tax=Streptomyces sp. NPDC046976 TaxID=3155258 RepID=UPI0033F55398
MATLRQLLIDASAGNGSVALIGGPVGCGKTALLQYFYAHAVQEGAFVLTATAARGEAALPLGVVRQLFSGEKMPARARGRVEETLGVRHSPDVRAASDTVTIDNSEARVADGLYAVLLELSSTRPVVVAVDDLQYADAASLRVLSYVQRRTASAQLLLVLTELSLGKLAHPEFHAELLRQPNCVKIRLGLLPRLATKALVESRLGPDAAAEVGDFFHRVSGGSPLLLSAMIDDYQAAAVPGAVRHDAEYASREALTLALTSCLHRPEGRSTDIAQALAVLGPAASVQTLAQVLDIDPESARYGLAWLTAAGLLEAGRFRHPVARTIILEDMAPADRRGLHLRVADVLHDGGAPPSAIAEHLVAAGRASEEWMIGVLRDAADAAVTADRPETAVRCLDLAHGQCGDLAQRAALTAVRARIAWRSSPAGAMRYVKELCEAAHAGHLGDQDVAMLLHHLLWSGRVEDARVVLADWRSRLSGQDCVVAEELTALDWSYPALSGPDGCAFKARETTPHSPGSAAGRWTVDTLAGTTGDETLANAEGVLRSNRLSVSTVDLLHAAVLTLLHIGRPDRAALWSAKLLREADGRSAATWQALFGSLRADAAVRQGDLTAAIAYGESAISRLSVADWGVGIGGPLSSLVLAASLRGEASKAAGYMRRPVPDATFETRFGLQYLHARGHCHLAAGRPRAALADFENCGHLMDAWGVDLPCYIPWRSGAAEVHLLLRDREAARVLVEEQMARPGGDLACIQGESLRLLAATAESVDERLSLLGEAVELLTPATSRFEFARCLADLSGAYESAGDDDRAGALRERALAMARPYAAPRIWSVPALPVAQCAEPASTSGGEALSEAEKRVADLAAVGHTNRAIARKLFITVSTVEQHLTRVYRKLSVRHRAELATRLRVVSSDSLCSS